MMAYGKFSERLSVSYVGFTQRLLLLVIEEQSSVVVSVMRMLATN